MRRAERPNCAGALRVRPAVARLFIARTRGSSGLVDPISPFRGSSYLRSWPAFGYDSFAVNDDGRERSADLRGSLDERTKKMAISGPGRSGQRGVGAVGGTAGGPR